MQSIALYVSLTDNTLIEAETGSGKTLPSMIYTINMFYKMIDIGQNPPAV